MVKIANVTAYNAGMARSMLDKLFWVDKINPDCVVDFGCADGMLLKELERYYPSKQLIGYDIDPEQCALARRNTRAMIKNNWDEIVPMVPANSALILSSVIHEVYSYGNPESIALFWERVFGNTSPFRYVVIRDLAVSNWCMLAVSPEEETAVRSHADPRILASFEAVWGSIRSQKQFAHFLLKYRYTENWERELNEDYLPLSTEALLAKVPSTWRQVMYDHYLLPWLRQQVEHDFGIEWREATHVKLIVERP